MKKLAKLWFILCMFISSLVPITLCFAYDWCINNQLVSDKTPAGPLCFVFSGVIMVVAFIFLGCLGFDD